jgi:hypothetical protein
MKKLVTLIGTLALASTLGLAGCKKKEEAAKDPAMEAPKATEPMKADPAAATEPAAMAPAAAPTAAGDMPAECTELKGALDKVAACDKIPAEAKDAFKNAWTGIETSFAAAATPEAKTAVGPACKASLDGLKAAAAACL